MAGNAGETVHEHDRFAVVAVVSEWRGRRVERLRHGVEFAVPVTLGAYSTTPIGICGGSAS